MPDEFRAQLRLVPTLWLGCTITKIETRPSKRFMPYQRIYFREIPFVATYNPVRHQAYRRWGSWQDRYNLLDRVNVFVKPTTYQDQVFIDAMIED